MKALYARCEQCGDPDGVLNPVMDMYLCPECTFENADYQAAQVHLEGLMSEAVTAWKRIWKWKGSVVLSRAAMIQAAAEQLAKGEGEE